MPDLNVNSLKRSTGSPPGETAHAARTVLLALPPGRRRRAPSLGVSAVCPQEAAPLADLSSLDLVRRHRVGGAYWRARVADARNLDFLVCVSRDPQAGMALWCEALVREPGARGLVVLEAGCDDAPFRKAGIACARDPEPHHLVENIRVILADEANDFALLGAAYGCEVTIGAQPLLPEQAAFWLVSGVRWCSPFSGAQIGFEAALQIAVDARRAWSRMTGVSACVGMAWWKRRRIAGFLDVPGSDALFFHRPGAAVRRAAEEGGDIAAWTSCLAPSLLRRADAAGVRVRRVEDGFVRSAGLGSDLLPPFSVVLDSSGIYFDASRESDLEYLLKTTEFTPETTARARRLIETLISLRVTKYGTAGSNQAVNREPFLTGPPGVRRLLVVGQVADDLSVRLGSPDVRGNLALLQQVRAANPDAFIVYRPHPDVDAGHRGGHVPDSLVLRYANRIERRGSISGLIGQVDEIHTMTSLAGFEALIRGRTVVTYGMPFYAGWGLTIDRLEAPPRRGRRLSVEELVAGTLLLYPVYLDPVTGLACGPEVLIDRLVDAALWRPTVGIRIRRLQGRLRRGVAKALMRARREPI